MRSFLLLLAMLVSVEQAFAGAWPRDEKEGFLSFASHVDTDEYGYLRYTQELYVEYGVTPYYTVIIDAFQNDVGTNGRIVTSLQRAFRTNNIGHRYALFAGLGYDQFNDTTVIRLGGSWGIGLGQGWINLDARTDLINTDEPPEVKVETTLGWRFPSDNLALFRVTAEHLPQSQDTLWLSPAYAFRLSDKVNLELGVEHEAIRGIDQRLKLGIWSRF